MTKEDKGLLFNAVNFQSAALEKEAAQLKEKIENNWFAGDNAKAKAAKEINEKKALSAKLVALGKKISTAPTDEEFEA